MTAPDPALSTSADVEAVREGWARCTMTLFGRCDDGRMQPWRGSDGHSGSETFYTCDRCGRAS